METSRGIVAAGQDNTGGAAILGTPYDPNAMQERLLLMREQRQAEQVKAHLGEIQKRKEKFEGLQYNPAWTRSQGELMSERDNMMNLFNQMGGIESSWDDKSTQPGMFMQDAQNRLETLSELDLQQKLWYEQHKKNYAEDPFKYNPQFLEKITEFDNIPTIEGRQQWIEQNSQALQPLWDHTGWLERVAVDPYTKRSDNGTYSRDESKIRLEDVKTLVDKDLLTPQGQRDYFEGIKSGLWKNTEEMKDYAYKTLKSQTPGSLSTSYNPPTDNGGPSFGSGYQTSDPKMQFSYSTDPYTGMNEEGRNYKPNRVVIKKNGKPMPPLYLTNTSGKKEYTLLDNVYRKEGKWYYEGRKVKEYTAAEAKSSGINTADLTTVTDDLGNLMYYKILEKVNGGYDKNKEQIAASTGGFDVYNFEKHAEYEIKSKLARTGEEQYLKDVVLNWNRHDDEASDARAFALEGAGFTKVQFIRKDKTKGNTKDVVMFKDPKTGETITYDLTDETDQAIYEATVLAARQNQQ